MGELRVIYARFLCLPLCGRSATSRTSLCAGFKFQRKRNDDRRQHEPQKARPGFTPCSPHVCASWSTSLSRLPSFDVSQLQKNQNRQKRNKKERYHQALTSEIQLREGIYAGLVSLGSYTSRGSNNLINFGGR